MIERDKAGETTAGSSSRLDSTGSEVGDVETAGETTAAEMIGGAPDTRPVGAGTLADIQVSDTPEQAGDGER